MLCCFFLNIANAQFSCTGDFYLSLSGQGTGTTASIFEVNIQPGGNDVSFNTLPQGETGYIINSMGYRVTDNYIYGVHPSLLDVVRVDETGAAIVVGSVQNTEGAFYVAGDVTPDGQFLALLGSKNFTEPDNHMLFIDLNDFSTSILALNNNANAKCADIAFDPLEDILYGYDGTNQQLIRINYKTGEVLADFQKSNTAEMMGAIFFDSFGELYGYGRGIGDLEQKRFFSIDKTLVQSPY